MFLGVFSCFAVSLGIAAADEGLPLRFEKDIRPILKQHCWQCHGEEDEPKGSMD